MKIVITGGLGRISKPLTKELVSKGHAVTVVSSKEERKEEIASLGASAAIGSVEDPQFLTSVFTGADLVYCMVPPNHHLNPTMDVLKYWVGVANSYAHAVKQSGVRRVIHLSSIGAHLEKDSGMIIGHRKTEDALKDIPGIAITHMRPVAFYYNLYAFIPAIKNRGVMASNYGADDRVPWVAPVDIAAAIVKEIETPATGRKIVYVASEEITCNEIATILGNAIGKPDLKWIVISDEDVLNGLKSAGLSDTFANGLTEMNAAMHSGLLLEDYFRNRPATLGKTKLMAFAKEFAAVYNQNK